MDGILEDVTDHTTLCDMWLQHDGAPPHFARQVRSHINVRFPNYWIGSEGAGPWPARSPVFMGLFQSRSRTEAEVREKIKAAIQEIKNNRRAFRLLKMFFIRHCRLCTRTRICNEINYYHLFFCSVSIIGKLISKLTDPFFFFQIQPSSLKKKCHSRKSENRLLESAWNALVFELQGHRTVVHFILMGLS